MIDYRIVWTDKDSVIVGESAVSASDLSGATRALPDILGQVSPDERQRIVAVDVQPHDATGPRRRGPRAR